MCAHQPITHHNSGTFKREKEKGKEDQRHAVNTPDEFTHLPKYRYTALKDPSRYIRLLKVTKCQSAYLFEAELIEACLLAPSLKVPDNEIPQYTALSYTWGQPDAGKALIIDGKRLHIRSNVSNFLTHVGAETTHELFWIDAICVDQSNNEERGQQVQLMRHIYSQANKVRVWLGSGNETLYRLLRDVRRDQSESGSLYITQMRELQDAAYRSNAQTGYPILSQLDYWSRLWVVQEIFFAKEIVVHYGREYVSWDRLREAWMVRQKVPAYGIEAFNSASRDSLIASAAMNNLIDLRENNELLEWQSMSLLLLRLDSSECTQRHDHVYAILSLIENGEQFPVDYDCSMIELLVETLAFAVRTEDPNHDHIQVFQRLAEKLLVDLDLTSDDRIHVTPMSGLAKTNVHRSTNSSSHQPWSSTPRQHVLSSEFGKGHGNFTWSTSGSMAVFTPTGEDTEERLLDAFGDNLQYIRHFIRSKTNDTDLVTWNKPLGIILILRPSSAPPIIDSDQPLDPLEHNSAWMVAGRIRWDRSLSQGSLFGRETKDRAFYELYTGPNGLPGSHVTMLRSNMNWGTTTTLTITDARSEIILFGLPEHQGVRLAAVDLMTNSRGHLDFLKVEYWADVMVETDSTAFKPGVHDIEVSMPPTDSRKFDTTGYIQYRPHTALCSLDSKAKVQDVDNHGSEEEEGDCYYHIDFLSEKDEIAACNVSSGKQ